MKHLMLSGNQDAGNKNVPSISEQERWEELSNTSMRVGHTDPTGRRQKNPPGRPASIPTAISTGQ